MKFHNTTHPDWVVRTVEVESTVSVCAFFYYGMKRNPAFYDILYFSSSLYKSYRPCAFINIIFFGLIHGNYTVSPYQAFSPILLTLSNFSTPAGFLYTYTLVCTLHGAPLIQTLILYRLSFLTFPTNSRLSSRETVFVWEATRKTDYRVMRYGLYKRIIVTRLVLFFLVGFSFWFFFWSSSWCSYTYMF